MAKKADEKTKTRSETKNINNRKEIANIERMDIEKSYNIDASLGTEAYFSNRYGWTLRRISK